MIEASGDVSFPGFDLNRLPGTAMNAGFRITVIRSRTERAWSRGGPEIRGSAREQATPRRFRRTYGRKRHRATNRLLLVSPFLWLENRTTGLKSVVRFPGVPSACLLIPSGTIGLAHQWAKHTSGYCNYGRIRPRGGAPCQRECAGSEARNERGIAAGNRRSRHE